MGVYLPFIPRLPSEYQEVEYIQSSGTQYINTGFIPTNNTKIELSMGGLNNAGSNCVLFGARASWSTTASTGRGIQLSVNGTNGDYGGMFGRRYNSGDWGSPFSRLNGGDYILEVSQSGFYENGVNKFTPQTVTFTSPVSLHIFNLNNNGATEGNSSYKLYYCKTYESGTLLRDFVPCYRKSDNVIGLYDLVNNQFYTNSGTGTFSKGADVTMAELKNAYIGERNPFDDYQEVEYIQSSGTQYIDTGFIPNGNSKAEFKISNFNNSSLGYIFGSYYTWGNKGFGVFAGGWSGSNGAFMYGTTAESLSSGGVGNGSTHTGELSQAGMYIDGNKVYTLSTQTFTGYNVMLFAKLKADGTDISEFGTFRMYYIKFYDNGTLVRDFIPCYRKLDNVIGLLDKVENKFYTNSGTGVFTKGPDIN